MAIIARRDLRSAFGSIRDQGTRPTCLAFAASDAHAIARGTFRQLSVEHLFYHAVQRTPKRDPNEAVSLSTISQALECDGQSLESGWPYATRLSTPLSAWRPPTTARPIFRHSSDLHGGGTDRIIRHLESGIPVIIVFRMSKRFYQPVAGLVSPGTLDSEVDYHAVIAVGHGTESKNVFILIRNSWGSDWGMQGYAWLAADYIGPRVVGLAVMTVPKN